jgi:hypothetical protein
VEAAITAAIARLGWRVYATNRPVAELDTTQVVLAYRDQYRRCKNLYEKSDIKLKSG